MENKSVLYTQQEQNHIFGRGVTVLGLGETDIKIIEQLHSLTQTEKEAMLIFLSSIVAKQEMRSLPRLVAG